MQEGLCIYASVCLCLSFSQFTVEHCTVCRKYFCMCLYLSISLSPKLLLSIARCAGKSLCVCLYLSQCLSISLSPKLLLSIARCAGKSLCVCLYLSQCLSISLSPKLLLSIGWCAGRGTRWLRGCVAATVCSSQ